MFSLLEFYVFYCHFRTLVLQVVCYFISGSNMMKDQVLAQKKGFRSMIKERKDLVHDSRLIEEEIMKIFSHSIAHGRAYKCTDRAPPF